MFSVLLTRSDSCAPNARFAALEREGKAFCLNGHEVAGCSVGLTREGKGSVTSGGGDNNIGVRYGARDIFQAYFG